MYIYQKAQVINLMYKFTIYRYTLYNILTPKTAFKLWWLDEIFYFVYYIMAAHAFVESDFRR